MWADKLKLNKQLVRAVTEAGYLTPKEVQLKTLTRIVGGQDIIVVSSEGSGKTTAYILGVLMRLKYGVEEAPRALILVPDKEKVEEVISRFDILNKNASIRIVGLYTEPSMQPQLDALADGVDIVVATPDRARAIYLKLGLNLNKIMMFIVDDAAQIVKQGSQLPVAELANSIIKCQHLVFTEVMHGKLQQMIDPFMHMPAIVEVEELGEAKAEVHPQILYHLPNFRTKLNLLNLLLGDAVAYPKAVVFVNTRLTAEKIYNNLRLDIKGEVAILNPMMYESKGFESIEEFKDQDEVRVLVVATELQGSVDLDDIPFLFHLELPEEKETFINRMIKSSGNQVKALAVTFVTDLELDMVSKIEQAIGQKMELSELPDDLLIAKEHKDIKAKQAATTKANVVTGGGAFHEKKASNKKDYNFSAGTKAKMNNKKKH
ncbi:MAG TPA: DEAD/DEAH box helicase [Mucilaginibacter sp.]|nr:DEAD/DEAH box helicase [Mucilaginibacter sp.]